KPDQEAGALPVLLLAAFRAAFLLPDLVGALADALFGVGHRRFPHRLAGEARHTPRGSPGEGKWPRTRADIGDVGDDAVRLAPAMHREGGRVQHERARR